jgi:hypothetical protein
MFFEHGLNHGGLCVVGEPERLGIFLQVVVMMVMVMVLMKVSG